MPLSFTGCQSFGRAYSDELNRQSATRSFIVKSSEDVVDLSEVLSYTLIPEIGDPYAEGSLAGLQCIRRTPMQIGTEKRFFNVVCEFETDSSYRTQWDMSITSKRVDFVPFQVLADWDQPTGPSYLRDARFIPPLVAVGTQMVQGTAVMNTAGDSFEAKQVTESRYTSIITLSRTFNSLNEIAPPGLQTVGAITEYEGTMNDTAITIAGITGEAWCFKIIGITMERLRQANNTFDTKLTFKIEYDPQTHAKVVLNAGFNVLRVGPQGAYQKATARSSQDGTSARKPVLLEKNGTMIQTGPQSYDTTNGPPYYVVLPLIPEMDFSVLQLPQDWE